ncbi:hypothetical protein [Plantibacter cousiniae (nom. nud.)]|uniref:Uncharacterized protein n=1 Tax=Plantibacter cousiniae (nom. nud.) TaxID=199709 RepID=A0ABY1LI21_9MICO|nr:hypothetical protein [Plantibacter cousiniae]SKC40393.1 hypothetical protein SAMN06295973_0605 [Plantibacter cousiniae]
MTPARARTTIIFGLVLLATAVVQLGGLLTRRSGERGDVFLLVLLVVQIVPAAALSTTGLWARKRGGSKAAPPVGNLPENWRTTLNVVKSILKPV